MAAPECVACGKPAVGGTFTELDSGYPLGKVTGTVEFDCGCTGRKIYSIGQNMSGWQFLERLSMGTYRIRKLSQAERLKNASTSNR